MSAFDAALKVQYPDLAVKLAAYKNNPLLALLPKREGGGGKSIVYPIHYGAPQGRSATYTTAGTNAYASTVTDLSVVRVSNYARADIDGQTIEASRGDAMAFMSAAKLEVDGALYTLTRDLACDIYHSGSGLRGRFSTNAAGKLTLSNLNDVVNFEVGMELVATTTEFSSSVTGRGTITSINRDTGVISTNNTVTFPPATDRPYLHVRGDVGSAKAVASRLKLCGLEAWIPSSAPAASEAFWGIDRSKDPTRLAGLRVTGTGQTVEEALIKGGWSLFREGAEPDICVLNPAHMADLDKVLAGRGRYQMLTSPDAPISFEAVTLRTPGGNLNVLADPNCPSGVAYMLRRDSWALDTIGAAPKILMHDGQRVLRNANTDSVRVNCGYYGNLVCFNPGQNGRISLDT